MTVEDRILEGARYFIKLPLFHADESGYSVALMNSFYEELASEIISYTENEASVRKYKAEYLTEIADSGEVSVSVHLSARIKAKGNPSEIKRRTLTQSWKNGYLNRHSVL